MNANNLFQPRIEQLKTPLFNFDIQASHIRNLNNEVLSNQASDNENILLELE